MVYTVDKGGTVSHYIWARVEGQNIKPIMFKVLQLHTVNEHCENNEVNQQSVCFG